MNHTIFNVLNIALLTTIIKTFGRDVEDVEAKDVEAKDVEAAKRKGPESRVQSPEPRAQDNFLYFRILLSFWGQTVTLLSHFFLFSDFLSKL